MLLLTLVTRLYIISPRLIYFTAGSMYLLTVDSWFDFSYLSFSKSTQAAVKRMAWQQRDGRQHLRRDLGVKQGRSELTGEGGRRRLRDDAAGPADDWVEAERENVRPGPFRLMAQWLIEICSVLQGKQMQQQQQIPAISACRLYSLFFSICSLYKPRILCSQVMCFRTTFPGTSSTPPPRPHSSHRPPSRSPRLQDIKGEPSSMCPVSGHKNWFGHGHMIKAV